MVIFIHQVLYGGILMGNIASPSALSLAQTLSSNASTISSVASNIPPSAAILVGGVLVTVGAAVFTYEKFKTYKKEEHDKQIKAINQLWEDYLSQIFVPGFNKIPGFPPPFKLDNDEKNPGATSMHYTDKQVRDLGTSLPHGTDVALSTYREYILSAMLKLKEFYFSREDKTDITAGVISYLLNMLETKCLNFQGYDIDIAYIGALAEFVDEYASMSGRENSQHFERLSPVNSYLLFAQQALQKHKENLSLRELISELRDNCANLSASLIRNLTRLIIPTHYADLSETVAIDELSRNIVRRRYVKTQIMGAEFTHDEEVNLPKCVFSDWIIKLSEYYLLSLNPIGETITPELLAPEKLFHFVPWAKSTFVMSQHSNEVKKHHKDELDKQLKYVEEVFEHTPNFINTKLVVDKKKRQSYKPVNKHDEIIERIETTKDLASVALSVITLQYLCTHLLKIIEQLGDLFAKDPEHCRVIFEVLANLCEITKKNVDTTAKAFVTISESSRNYMRMAKDAEFAKEVNENITSTQIMIVNLGRQIHEYRTKIYQSTQPTAASVKYEMKTIVDLINQMYPLSPSGTVHGSTVEMPVNPKIEGKNNFVHPDASEYVPPSPKAQNPQEQPTMILSNRDKVAKLREITRELLKKIIALEKENPEDIKIATYREIYQTLDSVKSKSIALLQEKNKDEVREEKADRIYDLSYTMCIKFQDYLDLDEKGRQEKGDDFANIMHDQIYGDDVRECIDVHKDSIPRFFSQCMPGLSIFHTDTRKKMDKVLEACTRLNVAVN